MVERYMNDAKAQIGNAGSVLGRESRDPDPIRVKLRHSPSGSKVNMGMMASLDKVRFHSRTIASQMTALCLGGESAEGVLCEDGEGLNEGVNGGVELLLGEGVIDVALVLRLSPPVPKYAEGRWC